MELTKDNLVSYSSVKDSLQPYDLIAFRGGNILSDMISVMEKYEIGLDEFTHVGMVVTVDILPEAVFNGKKIKLDPTKIYLFESTITLGNDTPDVISKTCHWGVQLRDLEEVIPQYINNETTKIAWCPLKNNPFNVTPGEPFVNLCRRRHILRDSFANFFRHYEGRLYQFDMDGQLAAMFPCLRSIRNVQDSLFSSLYAVLHKYQAFENSTGPAGWQFCSELVANVYKDIGVISPEFDARNIVPIDFFGSDKHSIPGIVQTPMYFKDWNTPNKPAIHYPEEILQL